jgi:hypothetical protein
MTNKRITFQNSVVVTDIGLIRALNGVTGDMAVVASAEMHGSYWFDISDTTTGDDNRTCIVATDNGRWKLVVLDADAVEYQPGSASAYRDGSVGAALAGLEHEAGVVDAEIATLNAAIFSSGGISDAVGYLLNFVVSLASSIGANFVGYVQNLVGAVATTLQERSRREVWLEDFLTAAQIADGMTGTPTLDIAVPFQAAIDACCPLLPSASPARKLRSNLVACLVGTTLNMTGSRVNGTRSRDGFAFEGNSQLGTQILGKTGFNHAVIETTGSQWLRLAHLYIGATGTAGTGGTASSVGIYQGLGSVLTQTQNQKFERVYINMPDDSTANQGLGTIGLWNFGAEENTYDNCYVTANVPVFMTSYKVSPNTAAAYGFSYQTLATSHSTGVNTFSGENFLVAVNRRMPSLITEDVNSLDIGNVYMSNTGAGGANDVAWRAFGAVQGGKAHGTIEGHGTALDVFGAVTGLQARWTFGTITNTAAARIALERGGGGQVLDCDINLQDNVSPNRALFSATPSAANEQISCYIANSTFKVACDKAYLAIQENVKWNPKTGNVLIFGLNGTLPYRYEIGYQTDRLDIPPKACLINGGITSAEVVRVIMPTITGASALGCTVRLRGMLSIQSAGTTNSMSVLAIDDSVAIALSAAGGIVATPVTSALTGTTANANAPGNNITAGVVTAPGGGTFVAVTVAPTRTGANLETVIFTGSAELTWSGNESRAPSLQLV